MVAHDLARREDLVRDFIVAASKTYGDSIVDSEPKMPDIIELYAMVSRMRVLGMPRTANQTIRDLRDVMKSGKGVDPLRDFAAAAREELRAVGMT